MKNQQVLHGVMITISSSSVSEMLSRCGFDWLWIDMEHAPLSLKEVQEMVLATAQECAALVRVPINSEEWIKRVLDLGAEGIILPHVNTAQEVEYAVNLSLYPPEGSRSVGLARSSRYGLNPHYKEESNENRVLLVQIEDKEGVGNIQNIVKVPGLDGVIIGPYDLSGSYGKLGQIEDPEVADAIAKVLKACKQANKPVGIFAKHEKDAKRYLEQGFQLVATGIDALYLWSAAKDVLERLKTVVPRKSL